MTLLVHVLSNCCLFFHTLSHDFVAHLILRCGYFKAGGDGSLEIMRILLLHN